MAMKAVIHVGDRGEAMTTILAVEDDDDLRELLRYVLEAQGYVVTTAENGLEALASVAESMPDLILLDVRMPVMSGVDFAAEYHRRYRIGRAAPVVVMTAAEHASRRSQEIGASDFLSKPFSTDELVDVVKRQLASQAPHAEA